MNPQPGIVLPGVLLVGLAGSAASSAAEKCEVAAYYFPSYHPNPQNDARLGKGWTEWDLVRAARPRFDGHDQPKVPLWGCRDESDPQVFEQKIDAAADHGVTSFLFDWYWHDTGPYLERGLEQGFLKAKNRVRLKFALMWANHDWIDIFPAKAGVKSKLLYPGPVTRQTFDNATDHIIRDYFSQPNHLTIDGKPYFSIYELMTLVRGLGGVEHTRAALESFRTRVKAAGLPGLHLNAVAWGVKPEGLAKDADELLKTLGIDSVTSYCWIHHAGLPTFPATPYAQWATKSEELWTTLRGQWKVPYYPNVSMGWDSSPRTTQSDEFKNIGYPFTPVVVGNTPAEFRKSLEKVKAFLDGQSNGPRMFTINAWNEWTEGSYLEPDTVNGMAYLEAIRDVFGGARQSGGQIKAAKLRCEYREDPLSIDVRQPRLSWTLESQQRGQKQTAWQVLAATSAETLGKDHGDLWDSGKVASDESIQAVYAGKPLGSRTQVWWKVRVWDRDGQASAWSDPATWSMGLLKPEDWTAKWIGSADPLPPVTRSHNGYHSELAKSADAAKWVVIDLGRDRTFDGVRLFPARPFDWSKDEPGFLFPMRFRVEVSDAADFAVCKTVLDQTGADLAGPGAEPQTYRFAAATARFVRLTATRLRVRDADNHALALAEMQVLSKDETLSQGAAVKALDSIENANWSAKNLTDGILISQKGNQAEPQPSAMLRKEFQLGGAVKRAVAYVSALGLYELRINGQRVGDQVLAPEWTDYNRRVQYQTYDVTQMLKAGENAVGAIVGEGWYAGRIGLSFVVPDGPTRGHYGRKLRLLMQLEIEMTDGSRQTVISDGSWKITTKGPVRSSDILDGETQDGRLAMPGWDSPGLDESSWKPVDALDRVAATLVAQPNEPIRIVMELKPVALTEPKPGMFVFDLGQNMVGWCRLNTQGPAGATVTLRHAEMLNPDGTVYTANLRGAAAIDRFILRGQGQETFEPHFTYHGFRYVEVTGLPAKLPIDALTGCVFYSSAPGTMEFACSSPMLTRLAENIVWTQRGNLHSSPTDCPQRDERLGWMGDAQVFSQTACFNMDMAAFFTKWVRDIRDAQADDGRFPDFAPHPFGPNERFSGVPCWGDAGVVVPWRVYVNHGDRRMLEEHFESARRWIEYIHGQSPDLLWTGKRGNDYGDWINADTFILDGWPKKGGEAPKEIVATAFFAQSTEIVSKMASALGRNDDAKKYAELFENIKAAFNRAYVKPDGRISGNTQAGYALALAFNLLPENLRPVAAKHMVEGIEAYKGHPSTGIQATLRLMLELTRNGYNDVAYKLINNRTMPSWGHMIDNGATTIWERWDGYVKGRGFQGPGMNSFNHYAFGSVGEWMYRTIAGINPDEAAPGYKHFAIRPLPGGGLTWVKAAYDSIRGRIVSEWKIDGDTLTLNVVVPANTTATVHVPVVNATAAVTESGKPAESSDGVHPVRREAGEAIYNVDSGHYIFVTKAATK